MAKPGITPDSQMRKKPQVRKISQRSAVIAIAGAEQDYPVYNFGGRVFVEKPKHNPFSS